MFLNTDPRMKDAIDLANFFRAVTGRDLVICGGFVRDVYFNKPHRDIDIYFDYNDLKYYSSFFMGISDPWEESVSFKGNHEDEYKHQYVQWCKESPPTQELIKLFPLLFGNGQTVNLVALRNDTTVTDVYEPDQIISRFNIGLSQIGVKLSSVGLQVHTTSAFWSDANTRRITVLRTGWGYTATAQAMRKYKTKFPEFRQYLGDVGTYDEKEFLSMEWASPQ